MGRTNKKYDEDYKKNIVKLIESGKPISDIEREYGINRKNIYNWKYKYGTITTPDGNITNNNDLEKLRKENRLLKEENEILKKASCHIHKEIKERIKFIEDNKDIGTFQK